MSEHAPSEKTERKVNVTSLILGIIAVFVILGVQWGTSQANQSQTALALTAVQAKQEENQAETKKALEENQKETKASIEGVSNQVAGLKETTLTQGFTLAVIQKEQGSLSGQISANTSDDVRQWENLRSVEALAKAALSREQFADWRREYERRNPGAVAPGVP